MENAGRGSGARRQPLPHVSSGPAPACAQQPYGMAWAAAAADDEGLRILLIQRRPAAMSPGQRHCSLPGAWRAPARVSLARSTCSLWLCCSRCGMMQSRARSLPSRLAPAPSRGRGGGWSQRGGREGTDGNIPRRLPPGARGHRRCRRRLHGRGERGPEAKAKAAGRARGEPPACSARCGREFLARLCPADAQPPRVAGTPLLCRCDVSASSGTCSKTFGAFPKEKQTVTNALGARASFSPPGLAASGTQTSAGFQCLPDAPPGARFHHHPLRLPSLPLSSLAWFTSLCHRIALLPLQRVFAKDCLPSHRGPVPSLPQDRHLFRKRDL